MEEIFFVFVSCKWNFQKFPGSSCTTPFTFNKRYKTVYVYTDTDQFLVPILLDMLAVLNIVDHSWLLETSLLSSHSPDFPFLTGHFNSVPVTGSFSRPQLLCVEIERNSDLKICLFSLQTRCLSALTQSNGFWRHLHDKVSHMSVFSRHLSPEL